MRSFRTAFMSVILSTLSNPLYAADINIDGAWVAEAPPMAAVMAGYMSISNQGKNDLKVLHISSPQFKTVELHEMITEANGMMSMRPISHLEIKAGAKVSLAPGGYHLMLYKPEKRFVQGDKLVLKFVFSDNTSVDVQAEVRKKTAKATEHNQDQMKHDNMDHNKH